MNDKFKLVKLSDMMIELGEEETKKLLCSEFSCPYNTDIDHFLKNSSILFEKQEISKTTLVYNYSEKNDLVGYYTIANKWFTLPKTALSKTLRKKIVKYGGYSDILNGYIVTAPLVAQLSKNFMNENNKWITGDELLSLAWEEIRLARSIVGGKIGFLECEDTPKIIDFYTRNGFIAFDKRKVGNDEKNAVSSGDYLVKMIKID